MEQFLNYPRRLTLALLLSLLVACGGSSDPAIPQFLTETDFAANPSLRLGLEAGSQAVTFLEPKDASQTSGDTGLPGTDVIPLRIAEPTTYSYIIDPADQTIAMAKLIRVPGNEEVLVVNAAHSRATVTLEPGAYDLVVYSGYTSAEAGGEGQRAVLLQNMPPLTPLESTEISLSSSNSLGFANIEKDIICDAIQRRIGNDLSGVNLVSCKILANLSYKNLTGADLSYATIFEFASLVGANLTRAKMVRTTLSKVNLTGATLLEANLSGGAKLSGTNLTRADLTRANLNGADLSGANLTSANLFEANLTGANLRGANLTGANLPGVNVTGANLSGAIVQYTTWPELGATSASIRICAENSIGTCR